ncbi:MAG: 1-acyl-sn-glycerol-3-phosphate acyltransferase [Gammaproteobacteria bacterium]|nr:1-acyl-sn-glycerol-3-phosphate acyltransferase [Gammaproteobacteria bacterium]
MKKIRVAYRLMLLGIHIAVGLIIVATLLRRGESRPPDDRGRKVVRWWLKRSSHIMGLRVKVSGVVPERPVLVVCNHISWLDIPVLGGVLPVSFVSKSDIRDWRVLGVITGRGGTLFIRRGGKNAANEAAEQIAFRLRRGDSIALFPEGTTTDGISVRRFHPRLFGAAAHPGVAVQPVAIRYPHPLGVHPAAPFVRNEPLFSHGVRALGEKRIDVEVTLCPPIARQPVDRRTLSRLAHEAIREVVEQQPEDLRTRSRG